MNIQRALVVAQKEAREIVRDKIYFALAFLLPVVLMPVSAVVEASAVVYAIVKPVRTFDVVDKHSDTSPSGIRMLRPDLAAIDTTDPAARAS